MTWLRLVAFILLVMSLIAVVRHRRLGASGVRARRKSITLQGLCFTFLFVFMGANSPNSTGIVGYILSLVSIGFTIHELRKLTSSERRDAGLTP